MFKKILIANRGEIALRNIAELAGMSEHCDFSEQTTTSDGKRPDMVVKLPEGRLIAIDSKVPLSGYLKAVEAVDDAARDAGLRGHVQAVRAHIKALAARDYAAELEGDVDLVVLFLPGDPFLAAAFGTDPDLGPVGQRRIDRQEQRVERLVPLGRPRLADAHKPTHAAPSEVKREPNSAPSRRVVADAETPGNEREGEEKIARKRCGQLHPALAAERRLRPRA